MEEQEENPAMMNQETGFTACVGEGDLTHASGDKPRKYSKSGSPPKEKLPSQQDTSVLQWSCPTHPATEQAVHRNSFSKQVPSSFVTNQRQTPLSSSQTNPQNSYNNLFYQNHSHLAPPSGALWWHPRPELHPEGSTFLPFSPIAPDNSNSMVITGPSSGIEPVSAYCYHGGYSYPIGFPGPWYPSSLWCQPQPPHTIHYPAGPNGCGYYIAPPPIPDSQPGNIRPSVRLSKKHQQMWETQSAENIYLRSAVISLEAELATYKSRLMQLEADVASLKSQNKLVPVGSSGTAPIQPSRRGRPKRSIASVNALPLSDCSQPKTRGRKRAQPKIEARNKDGMLSLEKDSLSKEQQCANDYIISSNVTNGCIALLSDGNKLMLPPNIPTPSIFHNRASQTNRVGGGIVHLPISDVNDISIKEENQNSEVGLSVPSPNVQGADCKDPSLSYNGASNGWQANFVPEEYSSRNMRGIKDHSFYSNDAILAEGRRGFPIWRCASDVASEEKDERIGSDGDDEEGTGENSNSAGNELG